MTRLAAEHQSARTLELLEVLWLFHGSFNAPRKPLNFISEHYLHYKKRKLFGIETQ